MISKFDIVVFEKLHIKILRSPGSATMTWSGEGDLHHPEVELLAYVSGTVESLVGRRFTIDFRPLSFMNSSTLSAVLVFMRSLHEKRIKTTLQFDPKQDWQRSASRCLRALSAALPSISIQDL